jgi:hypothetical protein
MSFTLYFKVLSVVVDIFCFYCGVNIMLLGVNRKSPQRFNGYRELLYFKELDAGIHNPPCTPFVKEE